MGCENLQVPRRCCWSEEALDCKNDHSLREHTLKVSEAHLCHVTFLAVKTSVSLNASDTPSLPRCPDVALSGGFLCLRFCKHL